MSFEEALAKLKGQELNPELIKSLMEKHNEDLAAKGAPTLDEALKGEIEKLGAKGGDLLTLEAIAFRLEATKSHFKAWEDSGRVDRTKKPKGQTYAKLSRHLAALGWTKLPTETTFIKGEHSVETLPGPGEELKPPEPTATPAT